jgi:hypothetical protein
MGVKLLVSRAPLVWAAVGLLMGAACSAQVAPASSPTPPARLAPALVQVENGPGSRPQSGLQRADLVFEYLTEGGISRFTALYWHPSGSARIGPVRSARLVTLRLVRAYGGVLFYSGASDHVQAQISGEQMPAIGESSDGGRYFARDRSRPAPHNLFTTQDQLREALEAQRAKVGYPVPATGEPPGGGDRVVRFIFPQTSSHDVTYTYDPASRTYASADESGPLVDAGEGARQIAVTSVVLVRVAHRGAGYTEDVLGAEGIDYDLAGSGSADVYTRGEHLAARWSLGQGPIALQSTDGRTLPLPAGLTWIHLVDPDVQVQSS